MVTASLLVHRLPLRFHLWWAVSTLATAGDAMLAFALIWTATSLGASAVALVSTLSVLPRILLLLFGGASADRHGPRRLLIGTALIQAALLAGLAAWSALSVSLVLLAVAASATAVVSSFQQPAAIVLPRLLISHEGQFARALARISGSLHAARILGVALGGLALTVLPLTVILIGNVLTVALFLGALIVILPRRRSGAAPSSASTWEMLGEALRSAHALRIWPLMIGVALVCASVLPSVGVILPSFARSAGWDSSDAGLLEGGWAAGTLAVTLVVSISGTMVRHERALIGGPVVIALTLAALSLSVPPAAAIAVCVLLGTGTALFTTHVAPMLLRTAPPDQVTRFQALMAIVQLVPPAVLNSPLAWLAGTGHAQFALLLSAGMAMTAAVVFAASRPSIPASSEHDHEDDR